VREVGTGRPGNGRWAPVFEHAENRASSVVSQHASAVVRRLRELADPRRAEVSQRFFRAGPGEYGEGDRFLGLTVPQIRKLASEFRDLPLADVETLLESSWHETRLLAVVLLADRYARTDTATQGEIYRLYMRRTDRINNWDLVDASAPAVVGGHLLRRSRATLRRLARSRNLWERRIAVVATQHFINRRDFDDTLRLAVLLIDDEHHLIHKAVGWMLREVGKRDERTLVNFLDRHAGALPRTALRYAIERLSPAQRKRYMAVPRRPTRR
jgi:3-methyladenine DNA glycosylase AlkD